VFPQVTRGFGDPPERLDRAEGTERAQESRLIAATDALSADLWSFSELVSGRAFCSHRGARRRRPYRRDVGVDERGCEDALAAANWTF